MNELVVQNMMVQVIHVLGPARRQNSHFGLCAMKDHKNLNQAHLQVV